MNPLDLFLVPLSMLIGRIGRFLLDRAPPLPGFLTARDRPVAGTGGGAGDEPGMASRRQG